MVIALLMLFGPLLVYLVSLPFTGRLGRRLRTVYRLIGGLWVVGGSGVSCYFAAYSGDQGGIAAFFMQLTVITVYLVLCVIVLVLNPVQSQRGRRGEAHDET